MADQNKSSLEDTSDDGQQSRQEEHDPGPSTAQRPKGKEVRVGDEETVRVAISGFVGVLCSGLLWALSREAFSDRAWGEIIGPFAVGSIAMYRYLQVNKAGLARAATPIIAVLIVALLATQCCQKRYRYDLEQYKPEQLMKKKVATKLDDDQVEPKPFFKELPEVANAEQITAVYKDRVFFVYVNYTETIRKQGLFEPYYEENATFATGSGILIANDLHDGLLVTNRHVIDPGYNQSDRSATLHEVKVKNPNSSQFAPARLVAAHPTLDLALLLVSGNYKRCEALRIARNVVQGESAVALGNPEGFEFITSNGIISGRRPGGLITTTCPISPGSSGGPLFVSRHGYLAGITTSFHRDAQNLNIAMPAIAAVDGKSSYSSLGFRQIFRDKLENVDDEANSATVEKLMKFVEVK